MDYNRLFRQARSAWQQADAIRRHLDEARAHAAESSSIFHRLAEEALSEEELAELADHPAKHVRFLVATRTTDADLLARFAAPGEDAGVRKAAASNGALARDVLIALADDADPAVRAGVASNARTPADVLWRLSSDRSEEVLFGLAQNDAAPPELLAQLADTQPRDFVLHALLSNEQLPEDRRALLAAESATWASPSKVTPAELLKSGIGILVVRRIAREEAARRPEDPGVAVLGAAGWLVRGRAVALARAGREDDAAVAEVVDACKGRRRALEQVALFLRCDGRAFERTLENRAHRLLEAAMAEISVRPLRAAERERIETLEQLWRSSSNEAFRELVDREPRLEAACEGLPPPPSQTSRELLDVPVTGWFTASPSFLVRRLLEVPLVGERVPRELLRLLDRLEPLIGPRAGNDDPIVRSHTALNLAIEHCVGESGESRAGT